MQQTTQPRRITLPQSLEALRSTPPPSNTALAPHKQLLRQAPHLQQRVADRLIWTMWLSGYDIITIADTVNTATSCIASSDDVVESIRRYRETSRDLHEADLRQLAAERVEAFRHIESAAWEAMSRTGTTPRYLSIVIKCEEDIARIQGVLSDKVQLLGRVVHEYKLYDFQDTTPPIEGSIVGESRNDDVAPDNQGAVAWGTPSDDDDEHTDDPSSANDTLPSAAPQSPTGAKPADALNNLTQHLINMVEGTPPSRDPDAISVDNATRDAIIAFMGKR